MTYACTSLSLDSTQAWDQPAGCRPSPEFSPSLLPTSAPWAERQKPPGRKRLELRCSEAKGPEGGCVVAPSSCSAKQLRLFTPYPQHTPCCSVSQALESWVKPTGQEEPLPVVEERETTAKSADCTADPRSARRRRRRRGPQPSSLPAFSIVIGNPSRVYHSPRLAQSPSRTRLQQAHALPRSVSESWRSPSGSRSILPA